MFTVQLHRANGPDEDFEYEDEDEAVEAAKAAVRSGDARRAVVIDEETGDVVDEVVA